MKKDILTLGLVSKGRLFEKSLQYLKKRNLTILYDKDKRSLSGVIKGMEHISINLLHARSVIDLLSQGILAVGISGLDLLADEIPTKRNKIKVIKRLDFGVARIMAIVPQAFCDVNTCADLEAISELELRKNNESLICSTKYINLARDFFRKKNIKNYNITKSLGATELECAQNLAHMLIDVVESGRTVRSNSLKTLKDSKIMDTSAVLLANKQALKNKNVAKIVKLLSK